VRHGNVIPMGHDSLQWAWPPGGEGEASIRCTPTKIFLHKILNI